MPGLSDLIWTPEVLKLSKWKYPTLDITCERNLNIYNNLSIKYNINSKHISIKNNGFFKSSLLIKDYATLIKNKTIIKEDLITKNLIVFQNMKDVISKNIDMFITNSNSKFTLQNYLNTYNLNIGNLTVSKDISTTDNVIVDNRFNILYNLVCKHNLNINNTYSYIAFNINNEINPNNTTVHHNLNITGNIDATYFKIDGLFIKNHLHIYKGILKLPFNNPLKFKTLIHYNTTTNSIEANCSKTSVLNDFHGYQYKSNINIYDTHNIDILVNNQKKFELTHNKLNLSYETTIYGNSIIFEDTYIYNNFNVNHNLNIHNNCIINTTLQLPTNNNKNLPTGSICFNTNSNELNVVYNNKLSNLQFLDKNNTGIFRNDTNINFIIKNNNIITFNNNTFNKNNFYISNNLNIDDSLHIHNNLYTNNNIIVNNIPIQFYNNLLRTYNYTTQKWTSLTLENYNGYLNFPYKSYYFYYKNITKDYNITNTTYYHDTNILLNKSNYFYYELITTNIYLTHLFFNIINIYPNNTYYIQIFKTNDINDLNHILLDTITINTNLQIIKLSNPIYLYTNNILFIKVKSLLYYENTSIIINLSGYNYTNINLKGDSNFITDSIIQFNQNSLFNVNLQFSNNVNIDNTLNLLNLPTNKVFNISNLHIKKKIYNNSLLEINNNFIINNTGKIGVGMPPNEALLSISNFSYNKTFLNTGGMSFHSNVNIFKDCITNNLIVSNNINTTNLLTNELNINKNITISQNLDVHNTTFINSNVNLITINQETDRSVIINKLFINNFNSSNKSSLTNDSIYLSHYNNNLYLSHKDNSLTTDYIYHNKIKTINNNININHLHIRPNNVSISSNNKTNLFHIDYLNNPIFSIVPNGNFYINNDIILDDININSKLKSILYDKYGPKNLVFSYNFINNLSITIYNNFTTLYKTIILNNNYFNIINMNNIYYTQLIKYPYYIFRQFNIYYDLVYFTEIILINQNIKSFLNNIKSYKIHNPYNYNISIYYSPNGKVIYPKFILHIYTNYGLKTEIK